MVKGYSKSKGMQQLSQIQTWFGLTQFRKDFPVCINMKKSTENSPNYVSFVTEKERRKKRKRKKSFSIVTKKGKTEKRKKSFTFFTEKKKLRK